MDINSLSHTKWNCKYHIVFAPKYRRKVIYGQLYQDIAKILDHVHMLVEIPPSQSVSSFVGYLKWKSTLMIFERHANLKYKYGNRHFWCRGYYEDTVGKNAKKIQEYIQNQLQEAIVQVLTLIYENKCITIIGRTVEALEAIDGVEKAGYEVGSID